MTVDPDGSEPTFAAGAVIAKALDRPPVAIQKLEEPYARLMSKRLLPLAAANCTLKIRCVEVLKKDVLALEPKGVSVNEAGLVWCVRAIAAHL